MDDNIDEKEDVVEEKDTANHYVDNKEFFKAMSEWKQLVIEAEDSGESKPPVTEYIGDCFVKIAQHLSYRPNFVNYHFREEMIGDGIENCLMYAHNFDPEKSKNPFSYFTQIIYYAFLRRIQKEKKQNFIKYKMMELTDIDGSHKKWYKENYFSSEEEVKDPYAKILNLSETDIENFTPKKKTKKKKKKNNKKQTTSLNFIEDDDSEDSTNK